jgi:hypothetical protein
VPAPAGLAGTELYQLAETIRPSSHQTLAAPGATRQVTLAHITG